MGSPNFCTRPEFLNLALEPDYMEDESDAEDERAYVASQYALWETFIENLPELYFHSVILDYGHHCGFQVYISGEWSYGHEQRYIDGLLDNWTKYQSFHCVDGYDRELTDCKYLPSNAKNLTLYTLRRAIQKEMKVLHNLMLDYCEETAVSMGEVIGSSWTSRVQYPIQTKKFRV